jgi:two-component system, NarL family, sensor histidine kinase DesK
VSPNREFGRDAPTFLRGNTHGRVRAFPALIWLGFILFPLVDAVTTHASPVAKALTIVGALAFVASYLGLVLMWRQRPWRPQAVALFAVLLGTAIALTLASGPGWGFLFTYCTAVVALFSSAQAGWLWVIGCAALAALCSAIAGASGSAVVSYAVTALGIGLLMVLMRDLRVRNEELNLARAELADAAVAEERERFARDLHDLLGHSLSVIALKAELAGRLLPGRPEQAATEVGEVEQVARQALREVRLAVSGYRQPTLEGELAGARMALAAAGIQADVQAPKVTLQPDVEAVLAWAVREGATNVIRHSRAGRATIRITAGLAVASVEVIDDGARGKGRAGAVTRGAGGVPAGGVSAGDVSAGGVQAGADRQVGNGLSGLRERAEAMDGRLEAGPLDNGGFRLMVSVPVSRPGSHSAPAPDATVPAPGADAAVRAPGADAAVRAPGADAAVPAPGADAAVPAPGADEPASPRAPYPVWPATK